MRDLRISVTDRCNFRCTYCMPFDEYQWMDRHEVLSFEEIERVARLFVDFGIEKVRLTSRWFVRIFINSFQGCRRFRAYRT